ncbi:MAG: hypothetical protein J6C75_04765 [Oscillospiraceae bacterium]|nr:hypothetical protein [Oscillospiraceae bacterium]
MNLSAILGTALLLGAVLIVSLAMKAKNEKEYKAAMAEYERKMEEYNAAVAAIEAGNAFAAPVRVAPGAVTAAELAAATAAILAAEENQVGEGEVKLLNVSEENAAMIIAILCDELGCNPADLTFRSITAL